ASGSGSAGGGGGSRSPGGGRRPAARPRHPPRPAEGPWSAPAASPDAAAGRPPADLLVRAAGFRSGFTVPLDCGGAISFSFADVGDHDRRLDEVRRLAPLLGRAVRRQEPPQLTPRESEPLGAAGPGLPFQGDGPPR